MEQNNFNYTLSVIIPAYNCEKTLEQTLDSVLNQKCKDIQIVLVNDGSKDGTDEICTEYSKNFENIFYYKKSNSGVSDTRNKGIEMAQGEYVAFLDSDDIWDKNYYDDDLNKKLKSLKYDILVFSTCFSDMNLKIEEYVRVKNQELHGGDKAVDGFYHHFGAFIFRTSFLIKNKLCFKKDIIYGEDELFRSECLYLADNILSEDKMSFYYRNNYNSSTKLNRKQKKFAEQKLAVYYSLKDFFFNNYKEKNEEIMVKNATTVSYFATAIDLLSKTGFGLKKIKQICQEENVVQMFRNNGKYYKLYYIQENVLKNYIASPLKFYIKNRIYGIIYYSLLSLKHFLVRQFGGKNK